MSQTTQCWARAPCLNLAPTQPQILADTQPNILVVCAGDVGHILATMAHQANMYIIEAQASTLARHLALLSICLDREIPDRTQTFLQVYGNLLISAPVKDWIDNQASKLIKLVTDNQGLLSQIVDFSLLKYRERDDLERVFDFWRNHSRSFDGPLLWFNLFNSGMHDYGTTMALGTIHVRTLLIGTTT